MADSSAAPGAGGVDDLDGRALRDAVTGVAQQGLSTARDRYVVAYQWCVTNPPADEYDVATPAMLGSPVCVTVTPASGARAHLESRRWR